MGHLLLFCMLKPLKGILPKEQMKLWDRLQKKTASCSGLQKWGLLHSYWVFHATLVEKTKVSMNGLMMFLTSRIPPELVGGVIVKGKWEEVQNYKTHLPHTLKHIFFIRDDSFQS